MINDRCSSVIRYRQFVYACSPLQRSLIGTKLGLVCNFAHSHFSSSTNVSLARKRLRQRCRSLARGAQTTGWRAMRTYGDRSDRSLGNRRLFAAVAMLAVAAGFLSVGFASPAQALPSFARQTGQPCGTCHTDFPALTPYGRRFKLLGYTTGGGEFRTTPFSSKAAQDARAEYDQMLGYVKTLPANPTTPEADKDYVPPISMMAIVGYTHTQAPLAGTTPTARTTTLCCHRSARFTAERSPTMSAHSRR